MNKPSLPSTLQRVLAKLEEISVYANEQVTGYVIPIHEAKELVSQALTESLKEAFAQCCDECKAKINLL